VEQQRADRERERDAMTVVFEIIGRLIEIAFFAYAIPMTCVVLKIAIRESRGQR
jgi:hypothetical protein